MKKIYILLVCCLICGRMFAQITDSISFSLPQIEIAYQGGYATLSFEGCHYIEEVGAPQLPYLKLHYLLPLNQRVSHIALYDTLFVSKNLNATVYPAQPPSPIGATPHEFAEPNPLLYNTTSPNATIEVAGHGFMKGYQIVTINLYPVQYNGATNVMRVATSMKFTLFLENSESPFIRPKMQSVAITALIKKQIQALVRNGEQIDEVLGGPLSVGDALTSSPSFNLPIDKWALNQIPQYLIITNNTELNGNAIPPYNGKTMTQIFQELADWKTQKGVPTAVITLDEIVAITEGYDTEEKIHNFLYNVYDNMGMMYVLFGGDVNIIPSRFVKSYGPDENYHTHLSDLYFTAVNTNWNANGNVIYGEDNDNSDNSSEFWYGRAPVDNGSEAQLFVNKIKGYENMKNFANMNNITNTNYVNNLLFVAGYYKYDTVTHKGDPSFIEKTNTVVESIKQLNITKWRLYDDHVSHGGNEELSDTTFINNLNSKNSKYYHLIYHQDHSGFDNLGASNVYKRNWLEISDVNNLVNHEYSQILYTHGCSPGAFDNEDCIIEHYIKNPNGGGVAAIASSAISWSTEILYCFQNFVKQIYQTTTNPVTPHIGVAHDNSIPYFDEFYKRKNHLFGDPEMPVWTRTPAQLAVSYTPSAVTNATTEIQVTVGNLVYSQYNTSQNLTVCLLKDNEIYARLDQGVAGQGGTLVYTFHNVTPQTAGNITLTVTGHNYLPYVTQIPVTISGKNLYISNTQIIDNTTNGNNNQKMDAGETVNLSIELKNNGTVNMSNISATLEPLNEVTLLTSTASYGNINVNGTVVNAQFKLKVSKEIEDGTVLPFKLTITDNSGYAVVRSFYLQVHAPVFKIAKYQYQKSGNTYQLTIKVANRGSGDARGVTGMLASQEISIISPSGSYGTIPAYLDAQNSPVFKIPVSYTNELMELTLTDYYGKNTVLPFKIIFPTLPILNFKFTSAPNSIKLSWEHISIYDCQGYNLYRSATEYGLFSKINDTIIPAKDAAYNDVGLTPITKYYYKITYFDNNGYESDPSGPFLACTGCKLKEGFPVQMKNSGKIKGSVNVVDINGDGKKEIFTSMNIDNNNGLLIGLRQDGTELFDIDNNPATYSGLAKLNVGTTCTPAIGDMNNDGIYEIISMTCNTTTGGQNYFYCHKLYDGNGDGAPDLVMQKPAPNQNPCSRAPVLANLDNSPDGSLESIYYTDKGEINIYNANGGLIATLQDTCKATFGAITVADIDGDNNGYLEILAPVYNGIAIWKYNGAQWVNYGNKQPFITLNIYNTNYTFISSVIVCDIDNDGDKEILTSVYPKSLTNSRRVIIAHHDGTVDHYSTVISFGNTAPQEIAVGDINLDGDLEIVVFGKDLINILDNSGNPIKTIEIAGLNPDKLTPILADVDGNPDLEIIFGATDDDGKGMIHALKIDGSEAFGFPIPIEKPLMGSPCVADLDNNGKNELIAASGNTVYVWETAGNAGNIAWGIERYNCRNTGEYPTCPNTVIKVNTTWTTPEMPCRDIIVQSGAQLTVKSTVKMSSAGKITVHPGGKLIVDGGTITSVSPIKMWQGITVLSDPTKPMQQQYQGYVHIFNNGKIENALCALHVMGGAMVETNNAYFDNNKVGVSFEPLASGQSGTSGNFSYTSFIQDNQYIGDPSTAEEHLQMEKCGQIHISDCLLSRPNTLHNPKGITVSRTTVNFLSNNYLSSVPMDLLVVSNVTVSGKMYGSDKITVHPAGKLVIAGGTLSNHSSMQLWEGIDVLGDPNPVALQPGIVQITNGGTIKNAKTGITAIDGGVVNAQNAHFIGNRVGVHFKPTVTQSGTSGTFTQTEFDANVNSFGNLIDFGALLIMDSCKQVSVTDCSFSGVASGNPDNGVVVTNASTLWTGDNQLLSAPVSLYNNATLTNTGIIKSNENADIAVYAGGKLMIDGGTFTNAILGSMWKGIVVFGDNTSDPPGKIGIVELQNGCSIKNALIGIHALSGGSVTATDAYFMNNRLGAQMEQGSTATFTNTQFNTTYSYPGNYLTFDAHLKLLNSDTVTISGCTFVNETNQVQIGGKTNNTGIQVFNANITCLNNSFSGFNTALAANNSGTIPFLFVSNNSFFNNLTGIKLNGNNYHNVRNNLLTLSLKDAVGIATSQATGYSITENTLMGTPGYKSIGMKIENSGIDENRIYKNYFREEMYIGIQALDVNSWQDPSVDPKALTGLQFLCNEFNLVNEAQIGATDIMVGIQYNPNASHSVRYYQGNPKEPAGNDFLMGGQISIANYSNYNIHYCYSTLSINEILKLVVGSVTKEYLNIPSDCPTRFDRNSMNLDEALAQYDRWNEAAAYWLQQLTNSEANQEENMYSYYSALKENFFNSIIIAALGINSPSNFEGVSSEAGRGSLHSIEGVSGEAGRGSLLRFLFNYRNHYTDNLCIVETYLAESNFTEAMETLARMYEKFKITKEQEKELTGLQIYVLWLQQLENEGKNIYELSEKELDYLVNFVTTNTGRGAVFANIILCELYKICLEDEGAKGRKDEGEKGEEEKGESHISNLISKESVLENITLVPNPTTGELRVESGELRVESAELRVESVEVFDIYGKKHHISYLTSHISNHQINISHLPAGVYFVKVYTEAGEVVKKVVKM